MIVHDGDPRLAMLEGVLADLGYHVAVAACPDEAVAAITRGPVPDVVLTIGGTGHGTGFARECLARWPGLRALYITFVPTAEPEAPGARESLLAAPFNAAQLEAALTTLWPAARAR
jgi:CheY-like chemotaxis protein